MFNLFIMVQNYKQSLQHLSIHNDFKMAVIMTPASMISNEGHIRVVPFYGWISLVASSCMRSVRVKPDFKDSLLDGSSYFN